MGDIATLIVHRLFSSVLVLWLVVSFVFFFMRLAGDPMSIIAGEDAPPEIVAIARARYGLDQPILTQYLDLMSGVLRGDFGLSFRFNLPAMDLVLERLPATFRLGAIAITLAVAISVPVGIYSALHPGSLADNVSRVIAVAGQSMPVFWLGILLIVLFAVNLGMFPAGGSGSIRHLVLPASTLAVYSVPLTMRLVRSSMMEVLGQEYVKTARAKGLRERNVIVVHALRNAMIPVATVIALRVGHVITGAVVLEEVFAYPGLGRLAISSMRLMDYNVIQAFVFVVAGLVIVVNLLVDILYGFVDPRIRVS